MRKVLIGLGVVVLILLGAGWWLLLSGSKAPAKAPGVMDLAGWRALVAADAGQGPERIGWLEIGHAPFPSFAVQAGRFEGPVEMSFNSVQLSWPDRYILIDTAVDEALVMGMAKGASFDVAAYDRMLTAISGAEQVVITHEHPDHVIGIARHPDPAGIAPNLSITELQRAALGKFAPPEGLADEIAHAQTLDFSQPVRIAPGVVVAPMAGHSPGSQVIYVQSAAGAEYLFIGDIAWTMRNIEELTTRPVLLNFMIFDPPEVRERVLAQLSGLHELLMTEPGLTIVPAHDRVYLGGLLADGRLAEGFR
ncbi:MBL fold metallo-hydrolase [Hyphomonas sp.]|uniref:MBL fold metallo-hydrolase n=1 Tax=Hyphomonas sp. TaxID=87 RepID=UPI00391DF044